LRGKKHSINVIISEAGPALKQQSEKKMKRYKEMMRIYQRIQRPNSPNVRLCGPAASNSKVGYGLPRPQ